MSKKNLVDQAEDSVEAPEGELGESVPVRSFDLQTRIRRHPSLGYCMEKISKDKDTGEETSSWVQISDFVMRPVRVERFVDQDSKTVQRFVEIRNPATGYKVEVVVKPQELASKFNFRSWLLSQGNFNFWGSDAEVERIMALTFKGDGDEVWMKNICGFEKETGNWIFTNGAVSKDGKVSLIDEKSGCISVGTTKYRVASNEKAENVQRAPTLNFGVEAGKAKTLLKRVIANTLELWGPGAEIGWAWALASIWRSRWIKETTQCPMLFVIGNASLGKTQFIKLIVLRLFGMLFEPISMRQCTPVGVYNLANQMCNIPLFLDEFKGEMINEKDIYELIKGNADGGAKVVGSLGQFETKSRLHRTGFIICGETRASDEALDTRSVAADLVKKTNTPLFNETVKLAENLSCALVPLLQQWDDLWPLMLDRKDVLMAEWQHNAPKMDSRVILNYARVCSTMDVVFPDEARKDRFFQAMLTKGQESQEKNLMAKMIAILPYFIQVMRRDIPFKVNKKKMRLAVSASFLLNAYADHTRSTPQSTRDLIRQGKQGKLLINPHPDEPIAVNIPALKEGRIANVTRRCFVFDMNVPAVKEVAEALSSVEKIDPSEGPPPDPNNPDDPFMSQ